MPDKDLHEYTPTEIQSWLKGEKPAAQGRTWRRRIHDATPPQVRHIANAIPTDTFLYASVGLIIAMEALPLIATLMPDIGGIPALPALFSPLQSLIHTLEPIVLSISTLSLIIAGWATIVRD